jgi:hypothetical protein
LAIFALLLAASASAQNTQTFAQTVAQSGASVTFHPSLGALSSLSVAYTISGSPATFSAVVLGNNAANLDTYSGTASTVRTISVSGSYTSLAVQLSWTGGSQVSVGVRVTLTGAAPSPTIPTVTANALSGSSAAPGACTFSNTSNPVVSYQGTEYLCGPDGSYHAVAAGDIVAIGFTTQAGETLAGVAATAWYY